MIAPSELIINADGSCFHLHLKPEQLADRVVLVGDPERVNTVAAFFDTKECEVASREFHTITGTYKGKRITALSHGIGTDNIDIVLNELDALANIDFATRTIRPTFRQLTLVRIGTSGGLQPFTPIGTYVAAEKSIGFDGVLYFYADSERVREKRNCKNSWTGNLTDFSPTSFRLTHRLSSKSRRATSCAASQLPPTVSTVRKGAGCVCRLPTRN